MLQLNNVSLMMYSFNVMNYTTTVFFFMERPKSFSFF
uniref:Uncharacterized protein n=1 Tax=Amphimedon queenslandica TaxID=400682 RepID=A0A1X7TVR1_AMPQE